MRVYADTSVFGGVFDEGFSNPSKQFFAEVDAGRFTLVTSAIVAGEIEPSPEVVQSLFTQYAKFADIVNIDEQALNLRLNYIESGVVTEKSRNDALHVAIATVSDCDVIVSWNFKHIVHFDKISKYNAVNVLHGFNQIEIHSPSEVINYENQ